MNLKEIVYCYVSETISMPEDLPRLRESFTKNGFSEKEINPRKWLYKRGAAIGLEFNYDSEAIQMQVVLEEIDDSLKVSVGNWGFPFEPLMMKKRFKKNLAKIVNQISISGALEYNPKEVVEIKEFGQSKKKLAWQFLLYAVIGSVLYQILIKT